MNPELKQKWVEALRSGQYKQTQNQYHDAINTRHCCIGVLACVVSGKQGEQALRAIEDMEMNHEASVRRVLEPLVGGYENFNVLTRMNDTGNSFTEIAAYIEANL